VQRGLNFDQLFVNGTRQTLARYPNADPSQPGLQGTATLAQVNALAANWSDFTMGDVRAMHCDDWGQFSGSAPYFVTVTAPLRAVSPVIGDDPDRYGEGRRVA
jgi:hypothetical protein